MWCETSKNEESKNLWYTCSTIDASLPRAIPHSSSLVITALPSFMMTRFAFFRSDLYTKGVCLWSNCFWIHPSLYLDSWLTNDARYSILLTLKLQTFVSRTCTYLCFLYTVIIIWKCNNYPTLHPRSSYIFVYNSFLNLIG